MEKNHDRSRRRYPRVSLNQQLSVRVNSREYSVSAVNVGLGGAFIEIDSEPELGSGSELMLAMEHNGRQTSALARVAWRTSNGYGVQYLQPSDEFTSALSALVDAHSEVSVAQQS